MGFWDVYDKNRNKTKRKHERVSAVAVERQ
jgi:hypothetical protein